MLTFTVRRLLYGVLLLFVIVTLAYLLLYAAAAWALEPVCIVLR